MNRSDISTVHSLLQSQLSAALSLTISVDRETCSAKMSASNPRFSDKQTTNLIDATLAEAIQDSTETLLSGSYEVGYSYAGGVVFLAAPKGRGATATKELLETTLLGQLLNLTTTLANTVLRWPSDVLLREIITKLYPQALRRRISTDGFLDHNAVQLVIVDQIDKRWLLRERNREILKGLVGCGDLSCTDCSRQKSPSKLRMEEHALTIAEIEKRGDIVLSNILEHTHPFHDFFRIAFERHVKDLYHNMAQHLHRDTVRAIIDQLEL